MNNLREIIRRTIKYILNAIVVGFAAHNIFNAETNKTIYIAIISATIFAILDIASPTISIN